MQKGYQELSMSSAQLSILIINVIERMLLRQLQYRILL